MKYILFIFIFIGSLFQFSCKEDKIPRIEGFRTLEEAKRTLEAERKYEMVKGCKVIERTRNIQIGISIDFDSVGRLLEKNRQDLTIPDDLVRSIAFEDVEAVKCLLDKGHDPNVKSQPFGSAGVPPSALHLAVSNNNPKIVKLLAEAGANVNEKDYKGDSFLLIHSDGEIAEILKAHGATLKKPIR